MKRLPIVYILFVLAFHGIVGAMDSIGFGGGRNFWYVTIWENGSAEIDGMNATASWADAPPGSFNLAKIDSKLGLLRDSNVGLEYDISASSSLRKELDTSKRYYPENLYYLKSLFREVLAKSTRFTDTPERFRAFLYETPPMGLDDLDLEDWQLEEYAKSTGQSFHWERRKPKSLLPEWSTVTQRITQHFPMVVEASVIAGLLFATPWPYLALGCLLALGLRRYRLNKSAANRAAPEAL